MGPWKRALSHDIKFSSDKKRNIFWYNKHAYHLYPLQIEFSQCSISKVEFFEKLREKNVFVQVHYIPLHLQPFYQRELGYGYGSFPYAEKYYERGVSLPMFIGLKQEDLEYIGESIIEVLGS